MRIRIGLIGSIIMVMLLLGAISLAASIIYYSSILAFIGLGLVFWGAILLYIQPEEHVRKTLVEAALSPSLTTIDQIMQELAYKGDATYLPPRYSTNPENTKIYISKQKDASLPTPKQIQEYENQPVAKTPKGMLLTPPGIQLSKLMEKSLGTSFNKIDLKKLQLFLPKTVIENLEIAENLEMHTEDNVDRTRKGRIAPINPKNNTIHARITKPIYQDVFREAEEHSGLTSSIGDPICSAIAIAITKASGKPVRITDIESFEDGNTIEATYEIIED